MHFEIGLCIIRQKIQLCRKSIVLACHYWSFTSLQNRSPRNATKKFRLKHASSEKRHETRHVRGHNVCFKWGGYLRHLRAVAMRWGEVGGLSLGSFQEMFFRAQLFAYSSANILRVVSPRNPLTPDLTSSRHDHILLMRHAHILCNVSALNRQKARLTNDVKLPDLPAHAEVTGSGLPQLFAVAISPT